ncbi:response regulator [Flavobacterium sp. H122]|uniref:response regulator n=1 Tax=Flavobacterium sp. H122 TaxID=2529860 RepID=UPI0010AA8FAF|nr:response regulator [Flavobacterium sp. H122]
MLNSLKIDVKKATDFDEFFEKINTGSHYDLLILDNDVIQEKDLEKIISHKKTAEKPIIIMHNSNSPELVFSNKINIHTILKPIKKNDLIDILNELNNPKKENTAIENKKEIDRIISINNLKILIVEDNKINMMLSKTLIQKIIPNAAILEAVNGAEAVDLFEKNNPHIIFMDLQMPVMNGYEASKKIREQNNECIIIALTAGIIDGEKEVCQSFGMNDYITKPINRDILESTLAKWVKTIKF